MRVPQLVSDFVEWRWAPCVGLTAGSVAFVALALLLIPTRVDTTRVGAELRAGTSLSSFDRPQPQRALFGSSLARSLTEPAERPQEVARALPETESLGTDTGRAPQRGFSPILERPEPVAPAAVEPPAPDPGTLTIIQPVPGGESREVFNP